MVLFVPFLSTIAATSEFWQATPLPSDYPSVIDVPQPPSFPRHWTNDCTTCPWSQSEFGPYPPPFNALPDFQTTHRGNYFDIYGHWMTTRYSEVFWTAQPAIPLPAHIVARYKGKAISITGFEVDIVTGGENGTTESSVPEYEVYNHHYCATITGSASKMVYVGDRAQDSLLRDKARNRRHAIEIHPPLWEPRSIPASKSAATTSNIPTAHNFWMGNGGEHRKSFKSVPLGTGQLIESPEQFSLQPMLINTKWPPQPGQTPRQAFHDAILPKASTAPPGANYSSLLECPCTTRVQKVLTGYVTRAADTCGDKMVGVAQECFDAAATLLGVTVANFSANDAQKPAGCFIVSSQKGNEVYFNSNNASMKMCGAASGSVVRSLGSAVLSASDGQLAVALDIDEATGNVTITIKGPATGVWFGIGFNAQLMNNNPWTIVVDGQGKVTEHKLENHMPGVPLAQSVDIISNTVGPAEAFQPAKMNHKGREIAVTPIDTWKACQSRCQRNATCEAWTYIPWQFSTVYNLDASCCVLRAKLHPDEDEFTTQGWKDGMMSGEIGTLNIRTVVMRRQLKGLSDQYYTFNARESALSFIGAVGTTTDFQYHGKIRGGGAVILVEVGAPVCVCRADKQGGSINGIPWDDNCMDYPHTTIKRDHNPSCEIESYGGGMLCCHHGVFLLDADQQIPEETFTFRMKYRFYYEDPIPINNSVAGDGASYQNAFFMFQETEESHGEYDVPQCEPGTLPEKCIFTIEGHFQIKDTMHECKDRADVWCSPSNGPYPQSQYVKLIRIAPHCHGPACIDMTMINADTNETICTTRPHYGVGDNAMEEAGYASGIPPCLWGTPKEGLSPPPVLHLDTNITVLGRHNNTYKHYGVMGHWQMRGIWA